MCSSKLISKLHYPDVLYYINPAERGGPGPTWGETFDDRLVVHLQRGVAATACESHHMVFAVAHHHRALLNGDVVCSHVEDHADLSPFLQTESKDNFY